MLKLNKKMSRLNSIEAFASANAIASCGCNCYCECYCWLESEKHDNNNAPGAENSDKVTTRYGVS